jgi:serine/threonine-protein kinase
MLPPSFALARDDRGFLFVFGLNWWLFTGAACGVMARVVHRLQSEVKVAQRLGQYELGEKVGQGGMGIVYRARHALMKRPVAIKLLPPEAAGQNAIRRFEREVQLTSQLSHPNTVVIHDYGRTHEGVFYYVMEFVEGANLDQVSLASGPMPSGRVVHILEMVAGALGEAHEHGLVHRDIKPANILLGPRGGEPDVVKVLDFGLVRAIRAEVDVTDANIMVGTPLFMSPEAMRAPDQVDGRSDLYSLGAVAYYLLSGCHVFDGKTALEICARHMQDTPRPLIALAPGIDVELEKIVLKCLAKEPANRFSSARELCRALSLCPSRRDWTADEARAWWAIHQRLLHPVNPCDVLATGEFENRDTEQRAK